MGEESLVRSKAARTRRQALARTLFGSGPIRSQMIFVWICVPPIVLYFAAFYLYPVISAISLSLHRWSFMIPEHPFIGLDNYRWVLQDRVFWIALKNTLYFSVFYVILSIGIGLALGVLIYGFKEPFKSVMQTVCFIPVMTSMVVTAQVWELLYMPGYGILNYFLGFFGLGPFLWTASPTQVMPSIIAMSVWKAVGYYMVLFIAGLTAIPRYLYEAAWIDGASRWQTFWKVTLPLLVPTVLFSLVTGSIGAFQVFTQVWVMTDPPGGPGKSSYVLLLQVFDRGFRFYEMGKASAIAFILFVIVMAVTLVQNALLQEGFEY